MTPKHLMLMGASYSLIFLIFSIIATEDLSPALNFLLFAFGAVFGKGYGIWEERNKK